MQQGSTNYYHPYDSDSGESDDSGSTGSSGPGDDISTVQQKTAGPFFSTTRQVELFTNQNQLQTSGRGSLPYNQYVSSPTMSLPDSSFSTTGQSQFKTERKDVTTLFLVDSTNRDRQAFPQPTDFTLRPPRAYKTVVSIQITQLKLLCSFFYFQASKGNITLPVIELDRQNANTYLGRSLTKAVTIREGTYAINDLLTEITTQLNFTPLFYDFPNGFTEFVTAFTTNGDFGVNFNEPGDTFFDTLNNKFIPNPTKDYIVKTYWVTRFAGLTTYSINQIKIAYYYPVLYEVLLDPEDTTAYPYLNLNLTTTSLNPGETVYIRVVFNSQGISDPVILELIDENITYLDIYRTYHTFRYSLVNRYQITYDANNLRINLFTLTLNTSLLNLFTKTSATSLATALQQQGYTSNNFIVLSNQLSQSQVVFSDMYNYIQNQLVKYFAIDYATYASQFFVNTNNILFIQNGFNASNVRSGYTLGYLTSGTQPLISSVTSYSNSPGYWPKFNVLTSGTIAGGIDPSGVNVSTNILPYSVTSSNFQFGDQSIDSSNYFVQTNQSTRSIDTIITIKPARYTVLKFRSPCRQTLQVETMPLPYYYRFADYNKQGLYSNVLDPSNNNMPQKYFDISYAFVYNTTGPNKNSYMDQSNYSSLQLNYTYGLNYATSFRSSPSLLLNVQSNLAQFNFTAPPAPPPFASTLSVYNTQLTFTSLTSSFPGTVLAFVYHDRAAFMADINTNYQRNEKPLHYIASNIVESNTGQTLTISLSTFTGHSYYTIFRSQELSFQNINYVPSVYQTTSSFVAIKTDYVNFSPLGDPSAASNISNYPFVTNYNTDFLRLPTSSTLQGIDPNNSKYTQSLSVTLKPLGYDISGVSDDLTDYRGYNPGLPGFVPNTQFRIDPISQFTFQKLTEFNTLSNTYFPPGNKNAILSPITNAPYTYKTNCNAEIKIVHWYEGYSIPTQKRDNFQAIDNISSATASSFQTYLLGANSPYSTDINNNIQFGEGIYAIGFLPQDGLYLVSSFTFKSVLYPITGTTANSQDPNMQIKHIGIFQGSYIANTSLLSMSNALEILTKTNTETYAPDTLSNTPQFGVELGTYYTFGYDPSFILESKINLNGYTQSSNQLLSYDALYYAVAFDENGSNITFTQLSGSILPYPLAQVPSSSTSYFGQTSKNPSGSLQQIAYITPSTIYNANSAYGPLNGYAYTQSQYEQSQPITTTSIGYRDYGFLAQNNDAFFTFSVAFSTSIGTLTPENVGLNTFVTEYDSKLWVVNSLSNNSTLSNAGLTFTGAKYASSLNTVINDTPGATLDSIRYLVNQPSTLQNYTYSRTSTIFQVFNYASMPELTNTSTTTQSFTLQPTSPNITVWLWGGGGGSIPSTTTNIYGYQPFGGAGAYVKATINVQQLYSIYGQSNSTISVVIGKGGNRDNFTFTASTATLNYGQARYGGGGTSLASTINPAILYGSSHTDDILPQGGGFSGLFLGSNILTAIPLLIVGGGGAGGAYSLGGPGGFGLPAASFTPSSFYQFSSVTINTTVSLQVPFSNVQDIDSLSFFGASPVTTIIDGNLGTTWNPTGSPFLQPYNLFSPTNQTYRVNLQFSSNVSSISRLRYYGPNQGDAAHPPTGFVVYNNQLKTQVLFSNTAISYGNYSALSNGTFGTTSQLYLDMPITSVISNTTVVTAGYVMTGAAIALSNVIQYSIDGSNWLPANTNGFRFNPVNASYAGIGLAVKYGNGIWLAGGYGQSLSLTGVGVTWSSIPGAFTWLSVAMSASGKYQIACGYGFRPFLSTNFGENFSPMAGLPVFNYNAVAISATGQYIVFVAINQYILISNNYGVSFTQLTDIGLGNWTGAAISASGQYIWVVLGNAAAYTSNNFGISGSWSGVGFSVVYVAVSGSGQYVTLLSTNNGVYVSNNYGASWTNVPIANNMYRISMSSSGRYQLIAGDRFNYISSNFGVSFTSISLGVQATFMSSAVSATGRFMLIGSANTGYWISINFGVNWTSYGPIPRPRGAAVAMSADGKYMLSAPNITGLMYRSVATTPTVVYPFIFYSTDGINWAPTTITEFDGSYIRSLCFVESLGLWIAGGGSGTSGSFLCSTDGLNWNYGGISNPYIGGESLSIRFLNGNIWSTGNGDTEGKYSTDGFTWTNVPGLSGYDITYGNGVYVATGYNGSPPYYSGITYSTDGINWFAPEGVFLNLSFFGQGVTYGTTPYYPEGMFIAVGLYGNNATSTRIYYSINGFKWSSTNDDTVTGIFYNQSIRAVVYGNSSFLAVGEGPQQSPYAPNYGAKQASVELSVDGLNWTYGLTGGYAPPIYNISFQQTQAGELGFAVDYGIITAIPNLSTLYMEIQKTSEYQIYFYELQAFGTTTLLLPQTAGNAITNMIDNNLTTFYWPSEAQTTSITSYPFNFTFSTPVTQINHLQIYSPLSNLRLFTSLTVATDTSGPLASLTSLTNTNFSTVSGVYLYDVSFIPTLSNISTLNLTFGKTTTSSIQLTEVTPYYNPSNAATQYLATTVTDLDNRGGVGALTVQTIISGSLNLNSYWNVNTWTLTVPKQTLRLNFTFNTVPQLNHMQIYSDIFGGNSLHLINGIGVFLDSTKSVVLYSNASPSAQQYKQFLYFDFDITTSVNVTSLYVELSKTTANPNYQPYIYQVAFYNVGLLGGTLGGFTGGLLNNTITQQQTALLIENGGGGTISVGGTAGNAGVSGTNTGGFIGLNYIGGNPAPNSGNAQLVSTFMFMSSVAGGGGGGYYGGGGGGTITTFPTSQSTFLGNFGGAGGGGAGFFSTIATPIISLVEYGVATIGIGTPSNYIAPGVYQQSTFIANNLLANTGIPYGYGGQPATTGSIGGLGGHGLVILTYDTNITVNPLNTNTASTILTDSSKLSLFQAPIDNTANIRSLTFGTYTEQIQNTRFSNYNWAWYHSYLSLVGGKLNSNLLPTIGTPRVPTTTYSNLPTSVYDIIASEFFNVSTFYNGQNKTVTNAKTITDTLNFSFQVFQVLFVATSYTSPIYTEFTQIYCLLDYLQVQNNLLYPHVNPANATLDRVFGGLPGFGYWANPFLTNTSFVGFDIGPSLAAPSSLVGLIGGSYRSNSMQAMYGLVIEQNLSTGYYTLKDIMSFKPNSTDIALLGSNWAKASQFNESFVIRNPESVNMDGYISVQPYDFKNAINGRLPLFNYKTYYTHILSGGVITHSPIHMINDFEGSQTFFYSYQNSNTSNYSSIFITHFPITSTLILLNNQNILDRSNNTTSILGTAISEYTTNTYASTSINIVNKFGYATTSPTNYYPKISIYQGSNTQGSNTNYYNIFSKDSPISSVNVGRLINDYNGNIYSSDRLGNDKVYENICTNQIYMQEFTKERLAFASPSFVLSEYNAGNTFPYTDFFQSKFANIWHLQGSQNMSTLYGARLQSPFDFTITTNFVNQVFYPVHKVTLLKKGAGQNPITQTADLVESNYPWYPHTEMFFYNNYSTMLYDISGDFGNEKTSNFTNADQFSGYFFDSFINNINLQQSSSYNNNNADSFYYLAVRAYSPSEQFKCLLRMALPGRYDFGFVTIRDLSNENVTIQLPGELVNPDYANVLTQFNSQFTFTSRTFGATGLPGYSGSNISSIQFGDFLRQYITIYNSIQTNTVIVSTVSGDVTNGIANLITGDLQYILPSTLVNRSRNQDPLQFALYLSTFVNPANQLIDQYGLGYNLGFARQDTEFNSIQRADSFFKILDDYIYLQMNPEYNMNRLDVSRQENFSATQDPTSESQLYNCKLLLNTFGSYAQTVVQNPVFFNPPIGKLDKLSFQWYDITGTLINNADCEWSAVLQITESVMVATTGSTLPAKS